MVHDANGKKKGAARVALLALVNHLRQVRFSSIAFF
jgi:hypothetical protein